MSDTSYDLFSWNTPNGQKIIIALEEAGANYTYHPINISKGEQHKPGFRALSPDGKIPVLVSNTNPPVTRFESGAILLYLAKVYPALNGKTETERAQVMSWTIWQVGQLGPLAGQFGRFSGITPANPDAVQHFQQLVYRCLEVLENRLAESAYLGGDTFTVADMASLPWIASKQSYLQKHQLEWRDEYPSVTRWVDGLLMKPSVIKALGN